ncbi:MAG: hypothetical protein IKQ94_07950 [Bacteroidales bacterium]|nr:hypothetical protein [Bacteroidales bacterium]
METHDIFLDEENQNNPRPNQEQSQEKTVEENTEQKAETGEKAKDSLLLFDSLGKLGNVVCSILFYVIGAGFVVFFIWLIIHLFVLGYNHWFGHIDGREIGENGLVYVEYENVIKKTCPNRTVLENVANLYDTGDTLSIIEFNGKYGLLNTNDASFIIPACYDRMWHLSADIYMGVRCDSLYTITIPSGKIIKSESAEDLYTSIKPISLSLYEYYFEDSDIVMYQYTNYSGKVGMMNKRLEKVTPAIYYDIEMINENAYFCQFDNPEVVIGELIDSTGNKLSMPVIEEEMPVQQK